MTFDYKNYCAIKHFLFMNPGHEPGNIVVRVYDQKQIEGQIVDLKVERAGDKFVTCVCVFDSETVIVQHEYLRFIRKGIL